MEFRGMCSSTLSGTLGIALNYGAEQRFCLVCNTPFISGQLATADGPKQAFCKVFQVEDGTTPIKSHSDLFCCPCTQKTQKLHQLQVQCEQIQAQISSIRDELGYCLVNTFSSASASLHPSLTTSDPNYALKLKVFQKWSYKYLTHPQAQQSFVPVPGHHTRKPPPAHAGQAEFNANIELRLTANPPAPAGVTAHHQPQFALNAFHDSRSTATSSLMMDDDDRVSISSSLESHQESASADYLNFQEATSAKHRKPQASGDLDHDKGEAMDGDAEQQCFVCGKMLTNDYLRKNHMQTHSNLKPYKCSMCDKSFANANYKKMHEKTHDKSRLQGEPRYVCSKCGRRYHLQKGLYKHTRYSPTCGTTTLVDHGKVRCQCELCGREFNSKYRLGVHVRGFHKKLRPVNCSICGRPCVDNQHELTHNASPSKRFRLTCPECPQEKRPEFDRKKDLEKHYASTHPTAEVPNVRRPTRHPRKFCCQICPESADATFTEKRALEYHMERFHTPRTGAAGGRKSKRRKERVMAESSGSESEDALKIKAKNGAKRQRKQSSRSQPERQSRRISEKYRNIRKVKYKEEDEEEESSETEEEVDHKDSLLGHGDQFEGSEPAATPGDFLQVKLEPEGSQLQNSDSD